MVCVNTEGSYDCECEKGFVKNADGMCTVDVQGMRFSIRFKRLFLTKKKAIVSTQLALKTYSGVLAVHACHISLFVNPCIYLSALFMTDFCYYVSSDRTKCVVLCYRKSFHEFITVRCLSMETLIGCID